MNELRTFENAFAAIVPWAGDVPRGFKVDFQGTLIDLALVPSWQGDRLSVGGGYVQTSFPTLDNMTAWNTPETVEWRGEGWFEAVNWYAAAREARDRFVMITLGAWHGSQALGSYRALQQVNPMPCKLVAVEPMTASVEALRRHFRDNGIDPDDHWLVPTAISGNNEPVFFAMGPRDMGPQNCVSTNEDIARRNYYKRIVESGNSEQALGDLLLRNSTGLPMSGAAAVGGEPFQAEIKLVSAITLNDLLGPFEMVDYLESDIQESEILVFPPFMALLKRKVRRIHIGTHGKPVHQRLHELFSSEGWEIVFSYEPDGVHETALGTFKNTDGVLTVRNPDV
jgi:hypothetical protein